MIFKDFGKCYEVAKVLQEAGYKIAINEKYFGKRWELVILDQSQKKEGVYMKDLQKMTMGELMVALGKAKTSEAHDRIEKEIQKRISMTGFEEIMNCN